MKTLNQIVEAAYINTDGYERDNQTKPKGTATWVFALNKSQDMKDSLGGKEYITIKNKKYAAAVKIAVQWAKSVDASQVWLQS